MEKMNFESDLPHILARKERRCFSIYASEMRESCRGDGSQNGVGAIHLDV